VQNAQINMPYYKNGDDFADHLEKASSAQEALVSWAETMESAAKGIRRIAEIISDYPQVEGDGDTHYAGLNNLPQQALDRLLAEELVWRDPVEDEYLEDEAVES